MCLKMTLCRPHLLILCIILRKYSVMLTETRGLLSNAGNMESNRRFPDKWLDIKLIQTRHCTDVDRTFHAGYESRQLECKEEYVFLGKPREDVLGNNITEQLIFL